MLRRLIDLTQPEARIARSPREADYRPDWRFQLFQRYSLAITSAPNPRAQFESILGKEKDLVLRQVLLYHFDSAPVVRRPVEYALICQLSNASNRIASAIRAMNITGRTVQQIGSEIGADPVCVAFYLHLFWDIMKHRDHRAWLKRLCFRPQGNYPTEEEKCEARWLQVGYLRGWAGLSELLSSRIPASQGNMKTQLDRFIGSLITRACDFMSNLEATGVAPSERDVQLFALMQHRLRELGIIFTPVDITYKELPTPEQQKKEEEAKRIVGSLSPAARKVLVRFLQKCETIAQSEEATEKESEGTEIEHQIN